MVLGAVTAVSTSDRQRSWWSELMKYNFDLVGSCLPFSSAVRDRFSWCCGMKTALATLLELIVFWWYKISGLDGLKKYTETEKMHLHFKVCFKHICIYSQWKKKIYHRENIFLCTMLHCPIWLAKNYLYIWM